MTTEDTSLSSNSKAVEQLEGLKKTIEDWKASRTEEIAKEVLFLKSLSVTTEDLTEDAQEETLASALEIIDSMSPSASAIAAATSE